ncbi:hypothetical protein ACWEKT_20105 [Nocardia takedensis]
MASEDDPASATAHPGKRTSVRAVGLWQRLAMLLAALAMNRAAKQIRERHDELAGIADGDDAAMARYAEKTTEQRRDAEARLQRLDLAGPREDVAAALVDALAWSDSSPIARKALDQLTEFYRSEMGLLIDPSGRTLTVDPDYPATHIQTALEESARYLRRQAAATAVTTLLDDSEVDDAGRTHARQLIDTWASLGTDTPSTEAMQDRRAELADGLAATDLDGPDRSQVLFVIDYLTDNHDSPHSVDLLDTPPLFIAPASPQVSTAVPDAQPVNAMPAPADSRYGDQQQGPHQQVDTNSAENTPVEPRTDPAAPEQAPRQPPDPTDDRPGAGDRSRTGGANPAQPIADPGAPGAAPPPEPAPPTSAPHPPVPTASQAVGVDRLQVTAQLRDYLAVVKQLHTAADRFADDPAQSITADMHQLVEKARTHRHHLLAVAENGPGLAPIERTQIRATLHDIDTGRTDLPTLLWVEEDSKRAADQYRHRMRGRDIAAGAVARVTETLTQSELLGPADPSTARIPAALHGPLDDILDALREDDGAIGHSSDRFATATGRMQQCLSDLSVDEDTCRTIDAFLRDDLPHADTDERPGRAAHELTTLLEGTGVLLDPAPNPHARNEAINASLEGLAAVIEAVAAGTERRDRLLRRYENTLNALGRQLVDAGADRPTLATVRASIDEHARKAAAHAVTGRDRRARWAERAVPTGRDARHQGPRAPDPSAVTSPLTSTPPQPASRRRRTFSPSERSRRFWQQHFRPRPATTTSRRG